MTVYTIGHSTLTPAQFASKMKAAGVLHAVDIRSHRSSVWPAWTEPHIHPWMEQQGLTYSVLPELGGWTEHHQDLGSWAWKQGVDLRPYLRGHFPKQHIAKKRPGPGWTNQGLYDYSIYMKTLDFRVGVRLLQYSQEPLAIFCAEALWWKCHRSMVADYLVANGTPVRHIMPDARIVEHTIDNRQDRYTYDLKEN